jgi:hypothetical protein
MRRASKALLQLQSNMPRSARRLRAPPPSLRGSLRDGPQAHPREDRRASFDPGHPVDEKPAAAAYGSYKMPDGRTFVPLIDSEAGSVEIVTHALAAEPGKFHLDVTARLDSGLERIAAGGIDIILVHLS